MAGKISVVVPIYDVEPYVEQCLSSIARQSVGDLQVVVVNDGSTDGGPAIAEGFAARDPRFVVVHQDNRGLGAARNAGAAAASGDFLSFVDGDDVLPINALAILRASLQNSGSDLATGVVRRFGGHRTNSASLTPFRTTVRGTHISRMPAELLVDRIVTNKLWRRSFWEGEQLRFPEAVLYEDITVGLGGHVAAQAVDVLRDTVYWWRRRGAGSTSITQDRAIGRGLHDRLVAVRRVAADMSLRGMDDLRRRYERSVLADDLRLFVDAADLGDAAYRWSLVRSVQTYLATVDPRALAELEAIERLKYYFLKNDMMDELLETLAFQRQALAAAPTVRHRGVIYGDYPFRADRARGVPLETYRLDAELQVKARISAVQWSGKHLQIAGHAYINMIDMPRRRTGRITLYLRDEHGRETWVPVRREHDPEATVAAQQVHHNYDGAGFTVSFNPGPLFGSPVEATTFTVGVEVECGGVTRRTEAWRGPVGPSLAARRRRFRAGHDLTAKLADGALIVEAERVWAIVDSVRYAGQTLVIRGRLHPQARKTVLTARRRIGGTVRRSVAVQPRQDRWSLFTVRLPLEHLARKVAVDDEPNRAELHDAGVPWQLRLSGANFGPLALVLRTSLPTTHAVAGGHEFIPRRTLGGHIGLLERLPHPTLTAMAWASDATLQVTGSHPQDAAPTQVLLRRRGSGEEHVVGMLTPGQPLDLLVPVGALPGLAGLRPLANGTWELQARSASARRTSVLHATPQLLAQLPSEQVHNERHYTLREGPGESLILHARPAGVLAPPARLRMEKSTPSRARWLPRRDMVVFNSWDGRRQGGDVRALYEELLRVGGPPAVWVSRGGQVVVPESASVEHGSPAHLEALFRARWVVTDTLLPPWWRPLRGQRVLQTWHGTPVKRTGFALPPDRAAAAPLYLRELGRQASAWDLLLSASPAATEVLRRTLQPAGDIVEAGAPRCDVAFQPVLAQQRAGELRSRLGLAEHDRVALWAPSARDEGQTGRPRHRLEVALRPPGSAAMTNWTFLVHGHPALMGAPRAGGSRWRDVTSFGDVHQALLIADVLVTDYSSLALDFLHTGRPLVLYAPDAETFALSGDGLAIDVIGRPPGHVTMTSEATWAAVSEADAVSEDHAARYKDLLESYGGPQDGGSSRRALERLLNG